MTDFDNEGQMFLRFEKLNDLADQLVSVATRRRAHSAGFKVAYLARPLMRQSNEKCWALTRADVRWLIRTTEERFKTAEGALRVIAAASAPENKHIVSREAAYRAFGIKNDPE
ncbi:hypothetical protein [Roseateles asaccharophilus]|uniref:Uncharacterized protein n=1 Tax=Roseateles asaccharophilus TaxID=582607 RepID=A0ABU2AAR8_9BURK|nr:hypothetical protein [Roseateles asaccharophilus]MDR7334286.1 hypothetical protein [Roseateles asaccharophilus]